MTRTRAFTLSMTASVLALGMAAAPADAQMKPGQGENSTVQEQTANFAQKSAMTNAFEIEAAKLALQKSQNSQVRSFAQHMIDEHQKMSQQLSSATGGQTSAAPSAQLDSKHTQKLQQLRQASGANFDRMYMDSQVVGHREALDLHQQYATSGVNAQLKTVAAQAVPHIQQHLQQAQSIQRQTAQVPTGRNVTPSDRSPVDQNPGSTNAGPRQMRPAEQPSQQQQGSQPQRMPPGQRQ